MNHRILVVEDELEMRKMLAVSLEREGFEVHSAGSAAEAREALSQDEFMAILTDVNLGDGSGLDMAQALRKEERTIPIVVMTAFGSLDTAIAAIRAGAYDFLTKPVDMEQVVVAMRRAARHRALELEVRRLRRAVSPSSHCGGMVGESTAMQALFSLVERLARTPVPVLIRGESGTGKELIARALHQLSPRAEKPFVAINCAAMADTLLESELFGHRKGAFTGADSAHDGLFVQADGGTLFLDEIGEMGADVQAKLLRALQEQVVRPVGATKEIAFDTRIISATNIDLEAAIKAGDFREDLFYRLNVVRLDAPPLRERLSDVPLLAQHFVEKYAARYGLEIEGLTRGAVARLMSHDWPGNVRELENAMARAVALAQFSRIRARDLRPEIAEATPTGGIFAIDDPELLPPMAQVEQRYIEHVLQVMEGNKSGAAGVLGLDRKTLYRKLERYAAESDGSSAEEDE